MQFLLMTKKFLSAPHQINVEPILQEYLSKACRLVNQPVSVQPSCSRNLCGWNGLVFWKVLASAASPPPLGARLSPALEDLPTHGLPGESHTGLGPPHLLHPYPECHFPILPFLRGSRSPISTPTSSDSLQVTTLGQGDGDALGCLSLGEGGGDVK